MRKLAVAALMLLGACGQKEAQSPALVTTAQGDELRKDGLKIDGVDVGMSAASPECAKRPAYAPLYPDAKIETCMALGKGGTITYMTAAGDAAVMAFYEQAAAKAGFETRVAQPALLVAEGATAADHLGVQLIHDEGVPATRVSLAYGNMTG